MLHGSLSCFPGSALNCRDLEDQAAEDLLIAPIVASLHQLLASFTDCWVFIFNKPARRFSSVSLPPSDQWDQVLPELL